MSTGGLILFVKNPLPGRVKTRIAATAGTETALAIYRALLARLREVVSQLPVERYAYFTDHLGSEDEWPPAIYHRRLQRGSDLGERMHNAIEEVLQLHAAAVLVGSDIPGLHPALLQQAFHALDEADVVLGPATDGGYYLVGMKHPCPDMFQGIAWSTPDVLAQTLDKLKKLGKKTLLLPPLTDIDTEADWQRLGWDL